jgi:hypothetical protein
MDHQAILDRKNEVLNFTKKGEIHLYDLAQKSIDSFNRNRSHQPSRIGHLNDSVNETVDKSVFQEFTRINKKAIEMISKR